MKFLRDVKNRLAKSRLISGIRKTKNIEIIVAAIFAILAVILYFVITASSSGGKSVQTTMEMTEVEKRVAGMISEISGVGESRVLITTGSDKSVVGVVVVAEGAGIMDHRVKIIRLVEKATGATVDQIEIFEMEKGG